MDQMAQAFTTRGKQKSWLFVIFVNALGFATIASRVILKQSHPIGILAYEDHRQSFNIAVGKDLALPLTKRLSIIPTLQFAGRETILTDSIQNQNPSTSQPPAKKAKISDAPAKKQKRCTLCPASKDRKSSTTCTAGNRHICQEHVIVLYKNFF